MENGSASRVGDAGVEGEGELGSGAVLVTDERHVASHLTGEKACDSQADTPGRSSGADGPSLERFEVTSEFLLIDRGPVIMDAYRQLGAGLAGSNRDVGSTVERGVGDQMAKNLTDTGGIAQSNPVDVRICDLGDGFREVGEDTVDDGAECNRLVHDFQTGRTTAGDDEQIIDPV